MLLTPTGKYRKCVRDCGVFDMSDGGGPAGTTILWELAGRDNNLPFLIVLLKKHPDQINDKLPTVGILFLNNAHYDNGSMFRLARRCYTVHVHMATVR